MHMNGRPYVRRDRHTDGNIHGGDIHTEETYTEGTTHRKGDMYVCRELSTGEIPG